MKTITIFIVLIWNSSILYSQTPCIVDAGGGFNDVVCFIEDSLILLGGNPTAIGGEPPYSYSWETTWTFGDWSDIELHASDFLNDTTVANPTLTNVVPGDELVFTLTVTDSNGNICSDSVTTSIPVFIYNFESCSASISLGDTITLNSPSHEGVEPLQYSWSPEYALSSSTDENPQTYPDTSTTYVLTISDANGCSSTCNLNCEINVNPVSIENFNLNHFKIHPNPFQSEIKLSIPITVSIKSIEILSSKGTLIKKYDLSIKQLNLSDITEGVYLLKIITNKGIITKIIIKQ